MGRGVDGKFKSSAPPGALTSGEDASGAGETRYEEPAKSLTIPVASIKNGESTEVQTRGAGQGGGGTNDGAEKNVSMLAFYAPRPKTYSTREPTPTHTTRNTRE
jgi:hypothetical protein